jgi:hypothetical protein
VGAYMLRPAVARWYIFKPKIPILEVLGIETVGTLYAHLKYTTAIWFILWPFGVFLLIVVYCIKKIWQPWLRLRFPNDWLLGMLLL